MIAFQIFTVAAVVAALSLYLYNDGAYRVYDVIISGVVIVLTSPLTAVLAVLSKVKNKKVFDRVDGLKFTAPKNALCRLPFFLLVFAGKKNIMPERLGVKRGERRQSK